MSQLLHNVSLWYWYNLCARNGWERAQGVGAHRFIRVGVASKYAVNGTITVSQSSWHARKVHAIIPHWILSHFAMVTGEVGLCWAVQWRKAFEPVYSFTNRIYLLAKFYIARIWHFALFTPVTLTLTRRPLYMNLIKWRGEGVPADRNKLSTSSFRKLSYYSRQT